MRYILLILVFIYGATTATSFESLSKRDLAVAKHARSVGQREWAVFFMHQSLEKKASSVLIRLKQEVPKHHQIHWRCQNISKIIKAELKCSRGRTNPYWREWSGGVPSGLSDELFETLVKKRRQLDELIINNHREQKVSGPKFQRRASKPYQLRKYNYVNIRANPYAWLSTSANDFQFSAQLHPVFPRHALFVLYTAIERMLKSRIVALGFRPTVGHYLDRLCASGQWNNYDCQVLAPLNQLYLGLRYPGDLYASLGKSKLQKHWETGIREYKTLRRLYRLD